MGLFKTARRRLWVVIGTYCLALLATALFVKIARGEMPETGLLARPLDLLLMTAIAAVLFPMNFGMRGVELWFIPYTVYFGLGFAVIALCQQRGALACYLVFVGLLLVNIKGCVGMLIEGPA